jgi:hypothetical protein
LESLPNWGDCGSHFYPAAHLVQAAIGPEVDAFPGKPGWTTYRGAGLHWYEISAIYDPAHRIGLFYESDGNALRQYLLIANAGPPPVAVKERDLSAVAMGGKVHLGDTLDKVRAAFNVEPLFHLTSTSRLATMSRCRFPGAAAYSAAMFYGPPHHPPISGRAYHCADVGPDIKLGQTLGTVVFREDRVAMLVWGHCVL